MCSILICLFSFFFPFFDRSLEFLSVEILYDYLLSINDLLNGKIILLLSRDCTLKIGAIFLLIGYFFFKKLK